jgi:hypothetical protein
MWRVFITNRTNCCSRASSARAGRFVGDGRRQLPGMAFLAFKSLQRLVLCLAISDFYWHNDRIFGQGDLL